MNTDSTPQRAMPRYKCHKEVHALKIQGILRRLDGTGELTPDQTMHAGYGAFDVDKAYMDKHLPLEERLHLPGYYVVYEGGYKSFSPAQAFEAGYTRVSDAG